MSLGVSDEPTPYAIICNMTEEHEGCGQVFLTTKEYNKQMSQANKRWICPQCGNYPVNFDDDNYESYYESYDNHHSNE